MNVIEGRVVSSESGRGIHDLLVVFYDLDASNEDPVPITNRDIPSDIGTYARFLLQGDQIGEDSDLRGQIRGDRLGSVLTSADGAFRFEFDTGDIKVSNPKEQRADLVICVVAPDRSGGRLSSETFPVGRPEIERLLHVTAYPIRNAGRNEQVLIRLSDEVLTRQDLSSDTSAGLQGAITETSDTKERYRKLRSDMAAKLSLKEQAAGHNKRRQRSDAFAASASAIALSQRKSSFFVANDDVEEAVIRRAESAGLARLEQHVSDPIRKPQARLRLGDDEILRLLPGSTLAEKQAKLRTIRETVERGESVSVELNSRAFCMTTQGKVGGIVLEKAVPGASLLSAGAIDREKRLGETIQPAEREGFDSEPTPEATETPEERIRRMVLAQVADLDETSSEVDAVSQSETVLRNLEALTPPSSPADVSAFHDFTHLQIAFPEVWSEALDRDLRDVMRNFHLEYQTLADEYAETDAATVFDIDAINPDELKDLKDYSSLLSRLGADIASLEGAVEPPASVRALFSRIAEDERFEPLSDTIEAIWPRLSLDQRDELIVVATEPIVPEPSPVSRFDGDGWRGRLFDKVLEKMDTNSIRAGVDFLQEMDDFSFQEDPDEATRQQFVRAMSIANNPRGSVSRVQRMLAELAQRLSQPHSFQVFQKDSVNFGIMTTYRQQWSPMQYQVGDLVSTLPLAPGQSEKFSVRQTQSSSREDRSSENRTSSASYERTSTHRAVTEIMQKASTTTNFQQMVGAQASGSIFGFSVGANSTTQFQSNQAAESQRVKKGFREAVRKASQEYKNEHSVEVSSKAEASFETNSESLISNPNNEITVTYLFYELERQYRVSEHLQRLTPVVMVAQEVPNPADIDEDWLLAHEWILRRSLLDESFHDALDFIVEGLAADEINLETRREAYETQRALVEELGQTVEGLTGMQSALRDSLVETSEREQIARVEAKRAKRRRRFRRLRSVFNPAKAISSRIKSRMGMGKRRDDPAALEARREALETRLDYLEGDLEDQSARLQTAKNAFEQATNALNEAVENSFGRRTSVQRLRLHVKDNILHYLHAIWSHEPTDQRFYRLFGQKDREPVTEETAQFEFLSPNNEAAAGWLLAQLLTSLLDGDDGVGVRLPFPTNWDESRRLHEIADLDKPLGFKGNYMIFPLKECTYLTDYMMQDFVDDYLGIRDPDAYANFSTEELLERAEKIWHAPETTDAHRSVIRSEIKDRLTQPRLDDELVVVPTGQLFIEALKGEHPLLEDFKHRHRALDLRKASEAVRAAKLENLRRAARLTYLDPDLSDPETDSLVRVEGTGNVSVDI